MSVPGTQPTFSGCRVQVRLPAHNRPSGLNVGSPSHSRRNAKRCRRSVHDPTRTNGGIRFSASAGIYPHALRVSTASGSRHCPGDPRLALEPGNSRTAELTLWRQSPQDRGHGISAPCGPQRIQQAHALRHGRYQTGLHTGTAVPPSHLKRWHDRVGHRSSASPMPNAQIARVRASARSIPFRRAIAVSVVPAKTNPSGLRSGGGGSGAARIQSIRVDHE